MEIEREEVDRVQVSLWRDPLSRSSAITMLMCFVLTDRVQVTSINQADCFWRLRTTHTLPVLASFSPGKTNSWKQAATLNGCPYVVGHVSGSLKLPRSRVRGTLSWQQQFDEGDFTRS